MVGGLLCCAVLWASTVGGKCRKMKSWKEDCLGFTV